MPIATLFLVLLLGGCEVFEDQRSVACRMDCEDCGKAEMECRLERGEASKKSRVPGGG